ncbi:mitochondrial processing peptidase, partial [Sarracenia purpurea var. burkii]
GLVGADGLVQLVWFCSFFQVLWSLGVLNLDFSFLEMNPFTLVNGEPYPLDMRGELDDTAAFKNFQNSVVLQLKSSLMLHIDGTSPVAEDIGRQLLTYGRRIPFAELFARIDAVDASTVKRVANRFIFDQESKLKAARMHK